MAPYDMWVSLKEFFRVAFWDGLVQKKTQQKTDQFEPILTQSKRPKVLGPLFGRGTVQTSQRQEAHAIFLH